MVVAASLNIRQRGAHCDGDHVSLSLVGPAHFEKREVQRSKNFNRNHTYANADHHNGRYLFSTCTVNRVNVHGNDEIRSPRHPHYGGDLETPRTGNGMAQENADQLELQLQSRRRQRYQHQRRQQQQRRRQDIEVQLQRCRLALIVQNLIASLVDGDHRCLTVILLQEILLVGDKFSNNPIVNYTQRSSLALSSTSATKHSAADELFVSTIFLVVLSGHFNQLLIRNSLSKEAEKSKSQNVTSSIKSAKVISNPPLTQAEQFSLFLDLKQHINKFTEGRTLMSPPEISESSSSSLSIGDESFDPPQCLKDFIRRCKQGLSEHYDVEQSSIYNNGSNSEDDGFETELSNLPDITNKLATELAAITLDPLVVAEQAKDAKPFIRTKSRHRQILRCYERYHRLLQQEEAHNENPKQLEAQRKELSWQLGRKECPEKVHFFPATSSHELISSKSALFTPKTVVPSFKSESKVDKELPLSADDDDETLPTESNLDLGTAATVSSLSCLDTDRSRSSSPDSGSLRSCDSERGHSGDCANQNENDYPPTTRMNENQSRPTLMDDVLPSSIKTVPRITKEHNLVNDMRTFNEPHQYNTLASDQSIDLVSRAKTFRQQLEMAPDVDTIFEHILNAHEQAQESNYRAMLHEDVANGPNAVFHIQHDQDGYTEEDEQHSPQVHLNQTRRGMISNEPPTSIRRKLKIPGSFEAMDLRTHEQVLATWGERTDNTIENASLARILNECLCRLKADCDTAKTLAGEPNVVINESIHSSFPMDEAEGDLKHIDLKIPMTTSEDVGYSTQDQDDRNLSAKGMQGNEPFMTEDGVVGGGFDSQPKLIVVDDVKSSLSNVVDLSTEPEKWTHDNTDDVAAHGKCTIHLAHMNITPITKTWSLSPVVSGFTTDTSITKENVDHDDLSGYDVSSFLSMEEMWHETLEDSEVLNEDEEMMEQCDELTLMDERTNEPKVDSSILKQFGANYRETEEVLCSLYPQPHHEVPQSLQKYWDMIRKCNVEKKRPTSAELKYDGRRSSPTNYLMMDHSLLDDSCCDENSESGSFGNVDDEKVPKTYPEVVEHGHNEKRVQEDSICRPSPFMESGILRSISLQVETQTDVRAKNTEEILKKEHVPCHERSMYGLSSSDNTSTSCANNIDGVEVVIQSTQTYESMNNRTLKSSGVSWMENLEIEATSTVETPIQVADSVSTGKYYATTKKDIDSLPTLIEDRHPIFDQKRIQSSGLHYGDDGTANTHRPYKRIKTDDATISGFLYSAATILVDWTGATKGSWFLDCSGKTDQLFSRQSNNPTSSSRKKLKHRRKSLTMRQAIPLDWKDINRAYERR